MQRRERSQNACTFKSKSSRPSNCNKKISAFHAVTKTRTEISVTSFDKPLHRAKFAFGKVPTQSFVCEGSGCIDDAINDHCVE